MEPEKSDRAGSGEEKEDGALEGEGDKVEVSRTESLGAEGFEAGSKAEED